MEIKALSNAFKRAPVPHTQTNKHAYTVRSHIRRKRRWMGVPGWQTGDPCHPWCPPSLCPSPVPFQLITISWFIQAIHQSDLIIHRPKIWIIKHLKPCLSMSAITIRSMCCCLLLKEEKQRVCLCVHEGFRPKPPHFTGRGLFPFSRSRTHTFRYFAFKEAYG